MKSVCFCLLFCGCPIARTQAARQEPATETSGTKTGLDVLIAQNFAPLWGKRVGLITNQTGIARNGKSGIDLLFQASKQRVQIESTPEEAGKAATGKDVSGKETTGKQALGQDENKPDGVNGQGTFQLLALFSPEHGLRGRAAAGAKVGDSRDSVTGLPVHSLYGKTQKPTPAMLRNLDTLVFDIQDIGSRSYTYISTLGLCMEAAAENHIAFVVLDRPNPSGGNRVEGNIPAPAFRSFVGKYPVPYLHGLTVGELARLLNGERLLAGRVQCVLTVVPMQGWKRGMTWNETGLKWIAPSPHVPFARTALFYAATGQVGELPALSIGIGTPLPFEYAGAPAMNAPAYAAELTQRALPGVHFIPAQWTPTHGVYAGKLCSGVHILLTDRSRVELCRLNFELIDASRKVMPNLHFFTNKEQTRMFDLVNGTDEVRKGVIQQKSAAQLWQEWNQAAADFRIRRQPYLLYAEN